MWYWADDGMHSAPCVAHTYAHTHTHTYVHLSTHTRTHIHEADAACKKPCEACGRSHLHWLKASLTAMRASKAHNDCTLWHNNPMNPPCDAAQWLHPPAWVPCAPHSHPGLPLGCGPEQWPNIWSAQCLRWASGRGEGRTSSKSEQRTGFGTKGCHTQGQGKDRAGKRLALCRLDYGQCVGQLPPRQHLTWTAKVTKCRCMRGVMLKLPAVGFMAAAY